MQATRRASRRCGRWQKNSTSRCGPAVRLTGASVDAAQAHVSFLVNAPFDELLSLYGRASIGLSTMVDEHFGINVVEMMVRTLSPTPSSHWAPTHTPHRPLA